MKKIIPIFIVTFLFFMPLTLFASSMVAEEEISLAKTEMLDDNLYAAGASLNIEGAVDGDVNLAGAVINVSGMVSKDLHAAGSTITILSPVGDDVRTAGAKILINERVGGELLAAGGMVEVLGDTVVEKDVWVAGGKVTFNGEAKGKAEIYGGQVTLGGQFAGDVKVQAEEKIIISKTAKIFGNLTYASGLEIEIEDGAQIIGEIIQQEYKGSMINQAVKGEWYMVMFTVVGGLFLLKLLIVLVTALVVVSALQKSTQELLDRTYKFFGKDLLTGFILAVLIPVAIVILLISIFLSPFALALLILASLFALIAEIFAGILFGNWIFNSLSKKNNKTKSTKGNKYTWLQALVGVLVLHLVCLVPIIGWIIKFIIVLAITGSLWRVFYEKFLSKQR